MDYQVLFNIAMGLLGFVGGVLINRLWDAMKDLQKADKELASDVAQINVLVAGQYVKRDTFDSKVDALFNKLDSMETKFEAKLDRAIAHVYGAHTQ